MNSNKYIANAFLSCSLRESDKKFNTLVANILHYYQFYPFGTVGLYSAATENPTTTMKKMIDQADIVVIAATKRYLTEDFNSGKKSNSLSEMVHTEAGMAFAKSMPIVIFVEEGTNVGSFLPSISQYITLDGTQANLDSQQSLIISLLNDAYQKSLENKRKKAWSELGNLALGALAVLGGIQLLEQNEE